MTEDIVPTDTGVKSVTRNEIAIATPQGSLLPVWWTSIYGTRCMYVTTLDKENPAHKAMILSCLTEEVDTFKDWINRTLDLIGYTFSPAARVVDGEVNEWVRVVLHCADGTNVAGGSVGVAKSLLLTEQLERSAPWDPPLKRVLRARDIGGGKQWYFLGVPKAK